MCFLYLQELLPAGAEKLGIIGLLLVAVVVLWRKLEEKDKVISEAIRIMERSTEASEAMAAALVTLRNASPPAKRD